MGTEKEFLAQRKYKGITDPVDATLQYALGVKKGFFDILADDPTLGETFHYAMQGVQKIAEKPSPSLYPFKEVLKPDSKTGALKTIVDVGGGSGHWMTLIQETYPDLQFRAIVQDFESAFATTQKSTNEKAVPIEYQAHDFFNPQPVKGLFIIRGSNSLGSSFVLMRVNLGAEIYFLSHIFHDWPSAQCVKILQRLVEVMKPKHSRLLIVDAIVPEIEASRSIVAFDAVVNIVAGGMERTRQQWLDLVSTASPRLTLEKTYGEASSTNQILEFLFE
jgi:O-methyltransferase domain